MKAIACLLLIGLVASSQANIFDDIGKGLLDNLKHTGLNVVQGIVDGGKKIVDDAWQTLPDLLSKTLFGKREVTGFADRLREFGAKLWGAVKNTHKLAGGVFSNTMDKLKAIFGRFQQSVGTLSSSKAAEKEVDDAVAEHNTKQKRIISDLIQQGKDFFSGLYDHVKNAAGKLVDSTKAKLSDVASVVLQKGADLLAKTGLIGKRAVLSLSDHLSNIGNALGPILSPFKDIVSNIGSTLKGHFSNLVEQVKGHVSGLKDKLSGHISDLSTHGSALLEHGKNALSALGEVANDVLTQTLKNAKPHLDGLVNTLGDGAKTVAGHFGGSN